MNVEFDIHMYLHSVLQFCNSDQQGKNFSQKSWLIFRTVGKNGFPVAENL